MPFFFTFPFVRPLSFACVLPFARLWASRSALFVLAAVALGAQDVRAEDRNPLYGITDWMGLTAPTGDRPDFVSKSRPDEKGMEFVPFLGPEKKRIAVKSQAEIAADEAALLAQKRITTDRLRKLNSEAVEALPAAPKPPPMTDKF